MKINISRWIVSILYGGFTLIAAVAAIIGMIVPLWSSVLMGLASIFVIIFNINPLKVKGYYIVLPLIAIHICAFVNGYYTGGNNIVHHLVRLIISVIIFVLFFLSTPRSTGKQ
jgi:hypothetical protein